MTREEREKCLRTIWTAGEDTKGETQVRRETEQDLNKTRDVLINNSLGAYNGTRKISNPAGSPIKTGLEIGSPAVRTDIPSAVTAAGANDPLYRAAIREINRTEALNNPKVGNIDVLGIANADHRAKVEKYINKNRSSALSEIKPLRPLAANPQEVLGRANQDFSIENNNPLDISGGVLNRYLNADGSERSKQYNLKKYNENMADMYRGGLSAKNALQSYRNMNNPFQNPVTSFEEYLHELEEPMDRAVKAAKHTEEAGRAEKAVELINYAQRMGQGNKKDNTAGRFFANRDQGRLAQDKARAYSAYINSGNEYQREYAEALDQLIGELELKDYNALQGGGLITKNLARYLPQLEDQTKAAAKGILTGAAAGFLMGNPVLGAKMGYVGGSILESLTITQGYAYETLIKLGIPHEKAVRMAQDEAVVSSIIEAGDSILDVITLGTGKAIESIFGKGVKELAEGGLKKILKKAGVKALKESEEAGWKKLLKLGAAYGINIGSETLEESMQEKVSIENEKRANGIEGASLLKAFSPSSYINETDENKERIKEAGLEGGKLAAVLFPMQRGTNEVLSYRSNAKKAEGEAIAQKMNPSEYMAEDIKKAPAMQTENVQIPSSIVRNASAMPTASADNISQNDEAVNKIFSDDVSEEVRRFGETLGESGRKFFYSRYENEADFDTYKEAFSRFYRSGETGLDFDKMYKTTSGELKAVMPETYARIVYELGEKDIKAETEVLKSKRAGAAVFDRKAGGFVESPESIFVDGRFKESAGAISKQLGMRTKIVPEGSIAGGAASASYGNGRVKIEDGGEVGDFGHEVGHRIKELAPEEYGTLAQFIIRTAAESGGKSPDEIISRYRSIYEKDGRKYTDNEIIEEIVNDEIGNILDTEESLRSLVEVAKEARIDENKSAKENLNIIQTIIKAIKEFVGKIKTALKRGKISQTEANEKISSAEKAMELLQNAYNSAAEFADEHRGQNESRSGKEEKYSIKKDGKIYDYSKTFVQQIEDWKKGLIPENDTLLVGATPEVFKKIGFNPLPVTINQEHIGYAIKGTKDIDHQLGETLLAQLPQALRNPIAVIKSTTQSNRVVAILKIQHNKKNVIAPIELDGYGTQNNIRIDSNAITSVFGKSNAITKLLTEALNDEINGGISMFYWNKKEALSLLQRLGLQLPNRLPQDGFIHSITENDSPVKKKITDITQTQQFKRWFGNSKVVNEDGTPKVVYHGTNENFNIFDLMKSGTNFEGLAEGFFFFTSKKDSYPNSAYDYAKNAVEKNGGNQEIKEVYLNIKKPLRLDSKGYYSTNEYYDRNAEELYIKYLEGDYDGIIIENSDKNSDTAVLYMVDNSKQIKSATDNIGTFDGENPDIRYSLKETKDYAKENAKLNKKVEALEKKLKEAKSLITPDMKALKELADSIKDEYSSEIESEELYNLMSGLKEKIKNAAEGKLSFNELLRYTSGLAREIIEQSVQLSSDRRLEYKELINQIKTTRFLIDDSVKAEFGDDWKDFRQKNQLRIGFTFDKSKATQGIDEFYRELEWNYPEFFDGLTQRSGKERLTQIEDVLESLKPVYENKFEGYMDEASDWLGASILDSIYSKTYFDIKRSRGGKLDVEYDLEAVQEEANSVVHKIMQRQADWEERQAKQIEKKYSEKTERVIERLRESKEKFIASEGEKFRERLENRETRKKKTERMRQIKFHFDRMVKKIEKPNNKNFIPEEIRKPVAQFLNSFDVRTDRMGDKTFNHLSEIYSQLKNVADGTHENADVRYSLFIDDETLGNLNDVNGLVNAFILDRSDKQLKVSELDLKALDLIYRTFLGIERSLSNYGRMISEGRGQLISTAAEKAISENRTDKAYSYIKGLEGGKNLFDLQMLNPLDFFHELGETFEGFYRDVRKGMDRKTLNLAKAKDYMEMCLDGLSIKELSGEKAKKMSFEITLEGELSYLPAERNEKKTVTLELTPAQAMSFYLLTKQEQAINHISEGGIVAPDRVETLVEIGKKYVKKGRKIDEEVYESAVGRAIKISLGEIERIRSQIKKERPELIETADLIGRFFTRECAGWGNEVSMSLYGYKKFVTRNYFPIVAGKNYVGEVYGKTNDKTLINTGITKDRTKGASNPLIIEDIFDVYARHVDKMSSYNAFVIPLQNLQSVLNYSNRETGMSLRSVLEAKYGKKANEYLSRFITDLNGGSKFNADGIEFINKAISHYKQAAMGLNVRVIIQQPLSIIRAGTEIDGKYLWGAMPEKTDIDIIYRYAPIALWKSWGFFSTDTSKSLLKIMTGQKEMSDYTMAGAAKADEWTWRRIWAACELEMKDRHPEVRSGTSEYYHMVGERFSEIIDKTQTVDSVLHRSHIQRSPNEFAKMGVSFMSEPIKTYNLVRTAFIDAKSDGTKEARQKRNRTIAVCAVQMLCTGIVTGLYDTGRGEDEDENGFFKQWTLNAGENFVGDLIGLVPFIKDMFSIIQGFEPKRMEMQTIANFVNAVGNFLNEKYTIHGKIDSLAVAAAEFFGIPAGKLKREIVSVFGKNIMRAGDFNFGEYTLLKLVYDIKSEKAKGEFLDVLYRAYKDGDEKDYDKIVSDMVKNGIPYSDIEKGLLSRARKSAEKGKRYNSFSTTFQAKINITEEEDETEKTEFTVDSLSPAELKEYSMVFKEKYNKISNLLSKYTFESNMLKNKALEKAEKYSKEIALREASGGEYVIGQKTDDGEVTDSENWVEAAEKAPGTLKISEAEFIYLTVKYKNSSTTLKSETMVKAVKEKIKPEEYLKFYEVIKKADKELKKVRDEAKEEGRNVRQSKQLKIRKYRNYLKDVDLPEERAEEILSFYIRNM